MAVLAAENVSYTYQSKYQKVQALKNVSCTFEAGKFTLVGAIQIMCLCLTSLNCWIR